MDFDAIEGLTEEEIKDMYQGNLEDGIADGSGPWSIYCKFGFWLQTAYSTTWHRRAATLSCRFVSFDYCNRESCNSYAGLHQWSLMDKCQWTKYKAFKCR